MRCSTMSAVRVQAIATFALILTVFVPVLTSAAVSVTLQPNQGPVGTGVTATGTGWTPGKAVLVYFNNQAIGGVQAIPDANGAFTTQFCVPQYSLGLYPVFFTNGSQNFNPPFTITAGTAVTCQSSPGLPDLSPTAILYNSADLVPGRTVFFDSGIQNSGSQGTGVFNVRWFVDDVSVGYGSHAGVPANSTVLNGNSQYWWPATAGTHTIKFVVDSDNHVLESNESNNSISVTVTVTLTTVHCPDAPFIFPVPSVDSSGKNSYIGWLYKVSTWCRNWLSEEACKDKDGKPIDWIDRSHYHSGLDFWASLDTPVMAQATGKVHAKEFYGPWSLTIYYPDITYIDNDGNKKKGVYVYIDNLVNGTITTNGKEENIKVLDVGSVVSAGQIIGLVGNVYGPNNAHVHWSVSPRAFTDQDLISDPNPNPPATQLDPTSFLTPKGNLNYATGALEHRDVSLSWWCNGK